MISMYRVVVTLGTVHYLTINKTVLTTHHIMERLHLTQLQCWLKGLIHQQTSIINHKLLVQSLGLHMSLLPPGPRGGPLIRLLLMRALLLPWWGTIPGRKKGLKIPRRGKEWSQRRKRNPLIQVVIEGQILHPQSDLVHEGWRRGRMRERRGELSVGGGSNTYCRRSRGICYQAPSAREPNDTQQNGSTHPSKKKPVLTTN